MSGFRPPSPKLIALRTRLRELREAGGNGCDEVVPRPRYDAVFHDGVEWLDSLGSGEHPPDDAPPDTPVTPVPQG